MSRDRLVLLLPVLCCLLALTGVSRHLFLWADGVVLDFFLSRLPRPVPEHPVVIVAKDDAFQQFFQRAPDRTDMATLLDLIRQAGGRTAALDFLYELEQAPDRDALLATALRRFPSVILAERFVPRGNLGALEQATLSDADAERPPWPLALFEPLATAAGGRGLINTFTDYGGVVRTAPLAFLQAETTGFRPSLGFAAWLTHQLETASPSLPVSYPPLPEGEDNVAAWQTWLQAVLASAPHPLSSLGHEGLDALARRWELRFLARQAFRAAISDPAAAEAAFTAQLPALDKIRPCLPGRSPGAGEVDLPPRTWRAGLRAPLPLVGPPTAPGLRLSFHKLPWPLKGDSIPTVSMGSLLQAAASGRQGGMTIAPTPTGEPLALAFALTGPGSGTLEGMVTDDRGNPVPGAAAFCQQTGGGFWATGTTDPNGRFRWNGLPPGSYAVEIDRFEGDCQQKLTLQESVGVGSEPVVLPAARFLPQGATLTVPLPARTGKACRLLVFGDGVWVARSGPEGEVPYPEQPADTDLTVLDDEGVWHWQTGGRLVDAQGKPGPDRRVALTQPDPVWKNGFHAAVDVPSQATSVVVGGLCPSLGAQVLLLQESAADGTAAPVETDLTLGRTTALASPPAITLTTWQEQPVRFALPQGFPAGSRIWAVTTGGPWRALPPDGKAVSLPPGHARVLASAGERRGTYDRLGAVFGHRAVFVGTNAIDDHDFVVTPINFLDRELKRLPGVNLHANLFSALCREEFLRPTRLHEDASPQGWAAWHLVVIVPLVLLAELCFVRWGAGTGAVVIAAMVAGWCGTAGWLLLRNRLLPCSLAVVALVSFGGIRTLMAYLRARARERQTRDTFGRFVSAQMVEEILGRNEAVKPGGEKKELTVMFTDLAGFTTISEMLAPEELTQLMNEYLGEMTDILFKHGGTLDKYIGDAIMGFWNHPATQSDHALRAARCAIAMQERLLTLRQGWRARGLPEVSMRAGINTAECMVGFIGSQIQMNFTCLGDGVNLASRMEGANKAYGSLMMVAESTHSALTGQEIRTRFLDFLAVKGKLKPMKVYELIGSRGRDDSLWEAVLPAYAEMICLYLARDWDQAIARCDQILLLNPNDGPTRTYRERCLHFRKDPPPAQWDGSYTLKTK